MWFLARVCAPVHLQAVAVTQALVAHLTLMNFATQFLVQLHVALESLDVVELAAALVTLNNRVQLAAVLGQ